MKKQTAILLLIALLVTALLAGCGSSKASVNVQSVATITGYGTAGTFNTCAGVVVAQDEIKVERDDEPQGRGAEGRGRTGCQEGRRPLCLRHGGNEADH